VLYRLLADVTAIVHLLFVGYVVVGGFLAWRWPRTLWLHLVAAGWGFGTIAVGYDCPLTHLENWVRELAGQQGLPSSGFIDHYLTGVIYPESALALVQLMAACCVLASWAGWLWLLRHRHIPAATNYSGISASIGNPSDQR